jgi:hypothetical protein
MAIQHGDVAVSLQRKLESRGQAEHPGTNHDDIAIFVHFVPANNQPRFPRVQYFGSRGSSPVPSRPIIPYLHVIKSGFEASWPCTDTRGPAWFT